MDSARAHIVNLLYFDYLCSPIGSCGRGHYLVASQHYSRFKFALVQQTGLDFIITKLWIKESSFAQ